MIVDAEIPRDAAGALASYGSEEVDCVYDCRGAWWVLHLLAAVIETRSVAVLGFSMMTEVIVHDPDGVDSVAVLLLPRDVQGALRAALNTRPTTEASRRPIQGAA